MRSVSVPAAAGVGEPCDTHRLAISDLHIEDPDFVWIAPPEVPGLARNARLVILYPRFLHTTAGLRDRGVPAEVIAGAMRYAEEIYGVAGLRDRLLFRQDDGDHHYGPNRREHTYEWFARTLLGRPAARVTERAFPERSAAELAVDISGTRTLAEELMHRARAEREYRFLGDRPTPVAASRAGTKQTRSSVRGSRP